MEVAKNNTFPSKRRKVRDVFWPLEHVFFVCKYIGLAPYAVKEGQKLPLLHSLLYFAAISATGAYFAERVVYSLTDRNAEAKTSRNAFISATMSHIPWLSMTTKAYSCLLIPLLLGRRLEEFRRGISSAFRALKKGIDLSVCRRFASASAIFVAFHSGAQFASQISGYVMTKTGSNRLGIMVYNLEEIQVLFVTVYFVCMLNMLSHLFEQINRKIDGVFFEDLEAKSSYALEEYSFPEVPRKRQIAKKKRLGRLARVHAHLARVSITLNGVFGVFVLISVVTSVTQSIYYLYLYFLVGVIYEKTFLAAMGLIMRLPTGWIVMASIVYACESTTHSAQKTGRRISKVILYANDPFVLEELRSFSNQVLRNRFKFTALEMFSIKPKLLISISSAIATNIIILAQFHSSNMLTQSDTETDYKLNTIPGSGFTNTSMEIPYMMKT